MNTHPAAIASGAAWIAGGALLLAGALVTGLLAQDADNAFTKACPEARDCDRSLMSLGARTERLALATDILLAAGGLTLGTGVTLLLLDDDDTAEGRPTAGAIHGAGLALHGRWP